MGGRLEGLLLKLWWKESGVGLGEEGMRLECS